ncbi:hypothetical protein KC19_9G054200 [Ceratodon purpureus]|uniref:Uncharacterized protein n=1 Tax=Ceratodon purpureus TaxID=3225 RepID=A0A8T0GP00_CERPU|nr:hypothetical protein KC19_9G054200 [Ceratodon purpureus]
MQRQKRIWRSLLPPSACSYTASIVTETDSLSLSPTHEPANQQQTDKQTNTLTHKHTHADSLTLRLSLSSVADVLLALRPAVTVGFYCGGYSGGLFREYGLGEIW